MPRPLLFAAALLALAPPVAAQPDGAGVRGESPQTRKRLAEAEQKAAAGRGADAVDDLQRLLDEAGDDLVSPDGRHFQPARVFVHRMLARLPADALAAYRGRVDGPARPLLDAGRRGLDPRPLRHLLDRYAVSRPAEDAILLLADLAFQRGDFRDAERLWRRLLPDSPDGSYPAPRTPPAVAWSRALVAVVYQGEPDRARRELDAFRAAHPAAAGKLAGRDGPFAATLQALLDRPPRLPPEPGGAADWPTFAGGPARENRVPGRLAATARRWPPRPTWKMSLPAELPDPRKPDAAGRLPFAYPVVAGGRALVADGSRVLGFDLLTGSFGTVPPAARIPPVSGAADRDPTLTAVGGRVFARLGRVSWTDGRPVADPATLVALGPADAAPPGGLPLAERWRARPPDPDAKVPPAWAGAPLVAGRRLWAVAARVEGGRVVHSIVCYDPADADAPPDRPAWVVEACDGPLPADGDARPRADLLTLAGPNVVFCSHAGAVVAVDAATGRRAWAYRYPRPARRSPDVARPPTDPAPPAYAAGRVVVAPADADRVFALDAETGRPLWESGPVDAAQLLGVAAGRAVVVTGGRAAGVRALSLVTGSHREPDGWLHTAVGDLTPAGRGLTADDLILWPTRAGLFFLNPDDGYPVGQPLPAVAGNLAVADGCLVAVTANEVWGFVPESKRFPGLAPARADGPVPFADRVDAAERLAGLGDATGAAHALAAAAADAELSPQERAWAGGLLVASGRADRVPADVAREWVVSAAGVPVRVADLTGPPPGPAVPAPAFAPPADDGRPLTLSPTARLTDLRPHPGPRVPLAAVPSPRGADAPLAAATDRGDVEFLADGAPPVAVPVPVAVTHVAASPAGSLLAGPGGFVLAGDDGWTFRVPLPAPLPSVPGWPTPFVDAPPPALSSFTLAGNRLFARFGDHHLIAFDVPAGRVLWVRGSDGRPRLRPLPFPGGPRFGPAFLAADRFVLAQLSDGRRWALDATTGGVLRSDSTAAVDWAAPPASLGPRRVAVADGAGRVRCVDPLNGRVNWTFDAGGEPGLAGDPPQVRRFADSLAVAVRRNHGVDVLRLRPDDGRSLWPAGPAFLDADRVDLLAADADADRVYVPHGDRVTALSLGDGKRAWDAALPATGGAAGWAVRSGGRVLVVYPRAAVPADGNGDPARLAASFARRPGPQRLPEMAATLYHAWADRTAPVLLLDPDTGGQLGRVDVPAAGPGVRVRFGRDSLDVLTGAVVATIR